MKKILFALPILAIGFFASYCSKENVSAPVAAPIVNVSTEDREKCMVTISTTENITICGLSANGTACVSCTGQNFNGFDFLGAGGNIVYNVNPVFPSVPFYIRNNSATEAFVTIATSGGPAGTWVIPAGRCYSYAVATTCILLSQVAPQ